MIGDPERCSQAYPVQCAQDNVTLLFFPDFSPATTIRRKAFNPVLKKMTSLGLQPFLIYPAVIKLRHKGEQRASTLLRKRRILSAACLSRRRMPRLYRRAAGRRQPLSLRPGGRGLMAGWRQSKLPSRGWWQDGHGCFLNPFFCFSSLLSPTGILSISIRYNDLFAGKTDTPFFFFGGD